MNDNTTHNIIVADSSNMSMLDDESIDLIVTSPPYPMIEMWDKIFSDQNADIKNDLEDGDGNRAFYRMHEILNQVWTECDRVLKQNGFVCINIGDATRTINGEFRLYPNHVEVVNQFLKMGYSVLPDIHWRKQSNAPNKFMGSGMYPAGAYVTYEHEYILIFRKGGKRVFTGKEKELRQKSAYFWEERNAWFSDLWDIKGTSQTIAGTRPARQRNASFPLEIPYRLINMYSALGDVILDPFAGLGTTNIACMISGRNSVGIDIDPEIAKLALSNMDRNPESLNEVIYSRIRKHMEFIDSLPEEKKDKCYKNIPHGFYVKTKQETAIEISQLAAVKKNENNFECRYDKCCQTEKNKQISMAL